MDKRQTKISKLKKTKGVTIIGRAKDYAEYTPGSGPTLFVASKRRSGLNQRQKRKLWRNAPHTRK